MKKKEKKVRTYHLEQLTIVRTVLTSELVGGMSYKEVHALRRKLELIEGKRRKKIIFHPGEDRVTVEITYYVQYDSVEK